MASALAGLTVLECGTRLAAAVCGRLLADLGADVLKIEPGAGDPARFSGPFPDDTPDPERSGLFAYLNRGKRSAVVELDTAGGRDVLRRLAERADVVLAGAPAADLARQGLRYADLAEVNPELVCTAITPFGLTGPYRDYAAGELVVTALSGVGYYVPGPVESPVSEPPLQPGGQIAAFSAGAQAASATMVAVLAQEAGAGGQQVDVSEQEALLDSLRMYLATFAYEGINHPRALAQRPAGAGPPFWRCADGYVWGIPGGWAGEYAWLNLVDAMESPEWALDPRLLDAAYRRDHWNEIRPHVESWAMGLPKAVVADRLQQRHIPCMAVNRIDELLVEEQLLARAAFVPLAHPGLGAARVPANPIRFDGVPAAAGGPAPSLGEHTTQALTAAGYGDDEQTRLRRTGVIQ
jgi:crotonobetainyl-CoA:carnitine CoA-transferase CaiB-like acyl-CoA transferase